MYTGENHKKRIVEMQTLYAYVHQSLKLLENISGSFFQKNLHAMIHSIDKVNKFSFVILYWNCERVTWDHDDDKYGDNYNGVMTVM